MGASVSPTMLSNGTVMTSFKESMLSTVTLDVSITVDGMNSVTKSELSVPYS